MQTVLIKRINSLAEKIFAQVVNDFSGAQRINDLAAHEYKKVEIAPNVYLTFQGWGENTRKPYFIILWRGSKYIMEFELSRIIFRTNSELTWILNVPTREENKRTLAALGYHLEDIDSETVNTINKQMTIINNIARKTPKGYVMAKESSINNAINKFLEIIEHATKENQQAEINGLHIGNEDLKVLEGQIAESKVLGRKRNQAVVEQRKIKDNHTCQVCNLRIKVNNRYVVECHHKNPLRGETITSPDDLVCLCPTCHRIAHRQIPPYKLNDIRQILSRALKSNN